MSKIEQLAEALRAVRARRLALTYTAADFDPMPITDPVRLRCLVHALQRAMLEVQAAGIEPHKMAGAFGYLHATLAYALAEMGDAQARAITAERDAHLAQLIQKAQEINDEHQS